MRRSVDYLNARLRGRKSGFLAPERVRELSRLGNLDDLRKDLSDTAYGPRISRLSFFEPDPALLIERAVGEFIREDLKAVRGFAPDLPESPAYFLFARWDGWNLKAIARGLHSHQSTERIIASLVMAGWVQEVIWREIASSSSVLEGAQKAVLLGVLSPAQLREAFGEGRHYRSEVASLESSIDRRFYREALAAFDSRYAADEFWSPALDSLVEEIDARNLSAILVAFAEGEPPEKVEIIEGGKWVNEDLLGELALATDAAGLLAEKIARRYGSDAYPAARALEDGNPLRAAAHLPRLSWRRQMRHLLGDPLSSAILTGYLWTRAAEGVNLRQILWGVAFGLGAERIGERLILRS